MKKLFISQPMNGKTDEEIIHERNVAVRRAKAVIKEDVQVIDNFFVKAPIETNPLWFLSESIEFLSTADIAYFAVGWNKARGCKIEYEVAKAYGINIINY